MNPLDPDYTLLNGSQLAAALGVDRRFVTAMRAAGYQFLLGRRTTLKNASQWLEEQGEKFTGINRKAKPKTKRQKARA